jgi:hypothetical protein
MKTLSDNTFFFDGEAASTVDKILQEYRALGYDVHVYHYHSRYWQEDCSPRGIVITEWRVANYLTVDCYTNTLF